MGEETLGRIVADAAAIEEVMSMMTLRPDPDAEAYYDEMLVEVGPDGVETPAGSTSSSLVTYCTVAADLFDEFETVSDGRYTAVFDIEEFTTWLQWVDNGPPVELRLVGDADSEVASEVHLNCGDLTAVVDCYRDPALLDSLTYELPSRFTDDERFRLETGDLAPTCVETTAEAMGRITGAVDRSPTVDYYPFAVEDDELHLNLDQRGGVRASGRLDATVRSGPAVHNEYDSEFRSVFRCLSGDLEIQTGPQEPLVVVVDRDLSTLRYVVMPVVW